MLGFLVFFLLVKRLLICGVKQLYMASKMLITSKKYRISNEAKNDKGFRVRTAGIDLSEFENNPILLWMHQRPKGEKKELLPVGNIVELELLDNELWGRLAFDPTDDFAVQLYNKYENGTLRMVSAGLVPLEFKEHNGEPWLDTSKLKEVSAVDIGSNSESYGVQLYQDSEGLVQLSFSQLQNKHRELFKTSNMKMITLQAGTLLPLLKLAEGSDAAAAEQAITQLVTLADTQKTTIAEKENALVKLQGDLDGITTKYEDLVKLQNTQKIEALCEGGVTERKYTKDQKAHFVKLAAQDFEGTKALIDSMPKQEEVSTLLGASGSDSEVAELMKLSYEDLDKSGKLEMLKTKSPEGFKKKFKDTYGVDYKG